MILTAQINAEINNDFNSWNLLLKSRASKINSENEQIKPTNKTNSWNQQQTWTAKTTSWNHWDEITRLKSAPEADRSRSSCRTIPYGNLHTPPLYRRHYVRPARSKRMIFHESITGDNNTGYPLEMVTSIMINSWNPFMEKYK